MNLKFLMAVKSTSFTSFIRCFTIHPAIDRSVLKTSSKETPESGLLKLTESELFEVFGEHFNGQVLTPQAIFHAKGFVKKNRVCSDLFHRVQLFLKFYDEKDSKKGSYPVLIRVGKWN